MLVGEASREPLRRGEQVASCALSLVQVQCCLARERRQNARERHEIAQLLLGPRSHAVEARCTASPAFFLVVVSREKLSMNCSGRIDWSRRGRLRQVPFLLSCFAAVPRKIGSKFAPSVLHHLRQRLCIAAAKPSAIARRDSTSACEKLVMWSSSSCEQGGESAINQSQGRWRDAREGRL